MLSFRHANASRFPAVRKAPGRALRSSLLVAVVTAVALAQTATDLDSPAVNRVAGMFHCSCGCNLSMACKMPPDGRCPICQPNKSKIFAMQQAGKTDQQIADQYVAENGAGILIINPGIGGVATPYAALGIGLLVVLYTLRRYRQKLPALPSGAGADPATIEQIEKDMTESD
jgi:cytochrome c-type biogenesis protein CcmH/NrfF